MDKSTRLVAHLLASEISGTAYSMEKVIGIEPTPYTEHIQADKVLDYMAEMNAKMQQLNDIVAKHFPKTLPIAK
jgi:GH25 family lysozyme M1 (1,4-beta-N-acetylmuramidase)